MKKTSITQQQAIQIESAYQQALNLHQAGNLQSAHQIYSQILAIDSKHSGANHYSGVIALQTGNLTQAEKLIKKAIKANPKFVQAYNNLGITQKSQGKLNESRKSFEKAISLNPDYSDALSNLGIVYYELDVCDTAQRYLNKAISTNPNHTDALNALGSVYRRIGELDKAIEAYQRALTVSPNSPEIHNNLGNTYAGLEQDQSAIQSLNKAIELKENYAEAHANIGNVYLRLGLLDQAQSHYQKAFSIQPDNSDFLLSIGNVQLRKGDYENAYDTYQRVLQTRPDLELAHSNLLLLMNYSEKFDNQKIFEQHLLWEKTAKQNKKIKKFTNSPGKSKTDRIRIGYVSPDFREHSVYYFVRPLLEHHDKTKFDIICYYNKSYEDDCTREIMKLANEFIITEHMDSYALAKRIKEDNIDILVDLAGHTADNCLSTFLYRPAPVQITWLGYPNTSGLSTMDYRITDIVADPVPDSEQFHSEKLIHMPNGFLCYQGDANLPYSATPACEEKGYITFGSFNNLTKITDQVIATWIDLLGKVNDSRLILKSGQLADPLVKQALLNQFSDAGIDLSRIDLYAKVESYEAHLDLYKEIDIGLDTFPYNGTTTTFEALWMGVPVITLSGDRHAARVGHSILSHLNLGEFIAFSSSEYIEKAKALAEDKSKISEIREQLREKLKCSPLCNASDFARDMEAAYIETLEREQSKQS